MFVLDFLLRDFMIVDAVLSVLSSIFYISFTSYFLCVLKCIWLLLVEVADARCWAEKIQDEPEGSCKKGSAQGREETGMGRIEGHRCQLEKVLNG